MAKALKCDRCGKFYIDKAKWEHGDVRSLITMSISPMGSSKEIWWDICPDCNEKLYNWLNGNEFDSIDKENYNERDDN